MTRLQRTIRRIVSDLDDMGVRYAIVGGVAMSFYMEARFTAVVDLSIDVASDDEAETVVYQLQQRGYRAATVLERNDVHRLSTVRLSTAVDPRAPIVDVLFASCGIEREIVDHAARLSVMRGVDAPVAHAGHLIAMKLLAMNRTTRMRDMVDAHALIRGADAETLDLARAAVRLIHERAFNSEKNLIDDLERLILENK